MTPFLLQIKEPKKSFQGEGDHGHITATLFSCRGAVRDSLTYRFSCTINQMVKDWKLTKPATDPPTDILRRTFKLVFAASVSMSYDRFLSLSLWLYSSLDHGRFFSFLTYTQSVGLLGRGFSPSQGRYLHTGQHEHRINAHRHPCLKWDSHLRSQCSRGRRRFVP
jgi:hypothetical protein